MKPLSNTFKLAACLGLTALSGTLALKSVSERMDLAEHRDMLIAEQTPLAHAYLSAQGRLTGEEKDRMAQAMAFQKYHQKVTFADMATILGILATTASAAAASAYSLRFLREPVTRMP